VVTVPNTFIATTEAISQAGAIPEFVDVDECTYNLSAGALDAFCKTQCTRDDSGRLISLRSGRPVKAVVPVHLYGQMADMDAILTVANGFGLVVVEDACQAHGAEYFSAARNKWMRAGSMGIAAAFSFYPGKNLGALGEGGAVTTDNPEIARKVRLLRDHGQAKKYYHDVEGYNGRLDSIQCAFLQAKLPQLDGWNTRRREHATDYDLLLAGEPSVITPFEPEWSRGVFHLYVVRVAERDAFIEHLKAADIGTGIHYPIPLHLQKAYASMAYGNGAFPVAERASREVVSLPMFPQLTPAQRRRVADAIHAFVAPQAAGAIPVEAAAGSI
jgi:dTDP-4-amino-4,6-dideoxygalactose transaminase